MSRTKIALIVAPAALLLAACSTASPTVSHTSAAHAHSTTAAPAPSSAATTSTAGLSGSWNGQYGGAFSGTFRLSWQQTGSNLNGTISLASAGTTTIQGTVTGSTIKFGTVGGSTDISYTGSVSGGSMSGDYRVQTSNGPETGSWSASRS